MKTNYLFEEPVPVPIYTFTIEKRKRKRNTCVVSRQFG